MLSLREKRQVQAQGLSFVGLCAYVSQSTFVIAFKLDLLLWNTVLNHEWTLYEDYNKELSLAAELEKVWVLHWPTLWTSLKAVELWIN